MIRFTKQRFLSLQTHFRRHKLVYNQQRVREKAMEFWRCRGFLAFHWLPPGELESHTKCSFQHCNWLLMGKCASKNYCIVSFHDPLFSLTSSTDSIVMKVFIFNGSIRCKQSLRKTHSDHGYTASLMLILSDDRDAPLGDCLCCVPRTFGVGPSIFYDLMPLKWAQKTRFYFDFIDFRHCIKRLFPAISPRRWKNIDIFTEKKKIHKFRHFKREICEKCQWNVSNIVCFNRRWDNVTACLHRSCFLLQPSLARIKRRMAALGYFWSNNCVLFL